MIPHPKRHHTRADRADAVVLQRLGLGEGLYNDVTINIKR